MDKMPNIIESRARLMRAISECEFVLCDLSLYLDTHPDCKRSLELYQAHKKHHDILVNEYNMKYGPLTYDSVNSDNAWTWSALPWPWETEGC